MRKHLLLVTLLAFSSCAGTAFAREHAKPKKPHPLADSQLDWVTAGHSGQNLGGNIVAAGSQANVSSSASVTMQDAAQQGAKALNLVNSSQSRVADAVNVWDGQLDPNDAATKLNVTQGNQVFQQGKSTFATLADYARTGRNVSNTYSSSEGSTSSSSSSFTNDSMVNTQQQFTTGSSASSSGGGVSGSESPSIDVKAGEGIAGTGKINASLQGATLNVGMSSGFNTSVSASGTSLFGSGSASGSLSAHVNTSLQFVLPKVSLSFDGGICQVELGICRAKGSESASSSSSSYKKVDYTRTVQAPVSIKNAKAQNIVVDGSTLTSTTSSAVRLSGNSEAQAEALNLVNAADSLISNALNVARTPTAGPVLNLNQTNLIVQNH